MSQTATPHRRVTPSDIATCGLPRATMSLMPAESTPQDEARHDGAASLRKRTNHRTSSADMPLGVAA